jgi:hypothetical protein
LVAQITLILWIFVSIALFAAFAPLRAFLLTYAIGYLVLPVEVGTHQGFTGTVWISQSIRIDKLTSCNIGAVLGTAIFAPQLFSRFRFHWVDIAYAVVTAGVFLTSMVNGLGAKDGLSQGVELFRQFFPLMVLSRIYLTSASELYEAMRTVVAAGFLYSFVAVAEWRLSPFIHNLFYGYFQHSFDQFMRHNFFRPVGFLRHAIEMSFFLGTGTALAAWLWHRKLLTPLWGVIPGWVVMLVIGFGLAVTMTYSGYGAFLIMAGMLGLLLLVRSRWVLLVLPVCAILWMGGRFTNQIDATTLLNAVSYLNQTRSESLEYRLESEELHLKDASDHLFLGKGSIKGIVREDHGNILLAVDAWWLIQMAFFGLVGVGGWYCVWGAGIVDSWRRWHEMTPDLQTLAAATSVMLGAQFIDFLFNAFPSPFLFILNMGLLSTLRFYRPQAQAYPQGIRMDELEMVPQGASMP